MSKVPDWLNGKQITGFTVRQEPEPDWNALKARIKAGEGEFHEDRSCWAMSETDAVRDVERLTVELRYITRSLSDERWRVVGPQGWYWRWTETVLGLTTELKSELFAEQDDCARGLLRALEPQWPDLAADLREWFAL